MCTDTHSLTCDAHDQSTLNEQVTQGVFLFYIKMDTMLIVLSPLGLAILVHVSAQRSCDAVSTYRAFSVLRCAVVGHIVRF